MAIHPSWRRRAQLAREAKDNQQQKDAFIARTLESRVNHDKIRCLKRDQAEEINANKVIIRALCEKLGANLPDGFDTNKVETEVEKDIEIQRGDNGKVGFKGNFGLYLQENRTIDCISTNDKWAGAEEDFFIEVIEDSGDTQRVPHQGW